MLSRIDASAAALARDQHGILGREQAVNLGFTKAKIRLRVERKLWVEVLPRTYVIGGAPRSWHQRATAALLWAGPEAVLSHHSAAFVHGWIREPREVDITIPPTQRIEHPDVRVHRADLRQLQEWTPKRGFRVTDQPRTILDLATEKKGWEYFESATFGNERFAGWLRKRLRQLGRTTSPGIARVREWLDDHDPADDRVDSWMEKKMRQLLRRAGITPTHHFILTARDGTHLLETDFAWVKERVALECDGRHHKSREARERRKRVLQEAAAIGWRIIPVEWDDLKYRPEEVLAQVKAALGQGNDLKRGD